MVALLLSCVGCKSLQKSSASTSSKTYKDPRFIDGIAMKPGEQKKSTYIVKQPQSIKRTSGAISLSSDIEKANWLQIKYAILLDMPVEDIKDNRLIEEIDHWWGTHYCLGGNNEQCIDCSGFTQVFLKDVFGIDIPRVASDQYNSAEHIKVGDLKEGDLVFFRTSGRRISHVGVYLCNNKFVHASVSSGVMISSLNEDYWDKRYAGAGRAASSNLSKGGDFGVR